MTTDKTISKSYRLPADKARVFNAWISSDYAVPPVATIVAEPHIGGAFCLHMSPDSGGEIMRGEFLDFQQDHRLQYTWQWQGSANVSTVDVQFADHDGITRLLLTHSGLDSDDSIKRHADGWDAYIAGLTGLLVG